MRRLVGRSRRRPAVWVTSSSWPSTSSTAISRQAARTSGEVPATSMVASLSARSETRVATLSPNSSPSPSPRLLAVPLRGDDVQGGQAAAGGRAVHDVVLDEREEVQQLQGRGHPHEVGVAVGATAGDRPAPVRQHRPEPLAVVAGPVGQLADEVDAQRTRVVAGQVTQRVGRGAVAGALGGLAQRVGQLDEGALEQGVGLAQRGVDRADTAPCVEVHGGHLGTHRLNRLVPRPVGCDQPDPWCGATSLDTSWPSLHEP